MSRKKPIQHIRGAPITAQVGEREIYTLLKRCQRLQVTHEELERFDDSSFLVERAEIDGRAVDPSHIIERLNELQDADELAEEQTQAIEVQGVLFAPSAPTQAARAPKYGFDVSRQLFSSLIPLVVQAFTDIRDGWSADYVVLHSEKNLDFLQRCWRLGAAATPEELNWTLLNARKDGKLAGFVSDNRYSIPKNELDCFSFAAEMALRELQDRAWAEEQRENLSLDKLFCSPRLSAQFDGLARQLAPGRSSLEYRWAAMTLRKARRLAKTLLPLPLFENAGIIRDVRPSRLTEDAGVYWLRFEDRSAFVGVADNLRLQIDAFIGSLGATGVPGWLQDHPIGKPRLGYFAMPKVKLGEREQMRSSIFRRVGSRLNFKDASLFAPYVEVA